MINYGYRELFRDTCLTASFFYLYFLTPLTSPPTEEAVSHLKKVGAFCVV
jgi:hypothetical protein